MQTLKNEIKQKIMDAGKKRFSHDGYDNTSMKDIAVDAGISTGNIYRYFLTKKHLLNEILNEIETEIRAFLDDIPSDYNKFDQSKLFEKLTKFTVRIASENGESLEVLFNCKEERPFIAFKENIIKMLVEKLKSVSKSMNDGRFDKVLCEAVAKSLFEGFAHIVRTNISDTEILRRNLNIYTDIMIVDLDKRVLGVIENA